MTEEEFNNLAAMIIAKCDLAVKNAQLERDQDLAALKRVRSLSMAAGDTKRNAVTPAHLGAIAGSFSRTSGQILPAVSGLDVSTYAASGKSGEILHTVMGKDAARIDSTNDRSDSDPNSGGAFTSILDNVLIAIGETQRGHLKTAVAAATEAMRGDFRSSDVEEWIKKHQPFLFGTPSTSISSALRRMVDDGKLTLVKQGAGQAPSIFRRKGGERVKLVEHETKEPPVRS